jgi:hypothetical protein
MLSKTISAPGTPKVSLPSGSTPLFGGESCDLARIIQDLHEQRRRIADAIVVFERLEKEYGLSTESTERVQLSQTQLPSEESARLFRRHSVAQRN